MRGSVPVGHGAESPEDGQRLLKEPASFLRLALLPKHAPQFNERSALKKGVWHGPSQPHRSFEVAPGSRPIRARGH